MMSFKELVGKIWWKASGVCKSSVPMPEWTEYLASFFFWLASGTDCRCCLGARVFIGFVVGLGLGLVL